MACQRTNQPCTVQLRSVLFRALDSTRFSTGMEDATMPGVKKASKRKHVTKAVPVLGAAGLTFSLAGGASASAVPTSDVPPKPNIAPSHEITLGEEEIADVSLATFYVFDKENTAAARNGVQIAWRAAAVAAEAAEACGGCRGGVSWLPTAVLAAAAAVGCAVAGVAAQLPAEAAASRGDVAAGARPGSFPAALTNAGHYGRVRQGRPGQSMYPLHREPAYWTMCTC